MRRPYFYWRPRQLPPSGWVFVTFFVASLWMGCNAVRHRTPAEQAAAEQLPVTWAFKTCQGITDYARQNGWNVNSVQRIISVGESSYSYTATKEDVTLTYQCGNEPSGPPQEVCFIWAGHDNCASRPPRRM